MRKPSRLFQFSRETDKFNGVSFFAFMKSLDGPASEPAAEWW